MPFYSGTHTATISTITIFLRHCTTLRAGHLDGLPHTTFLNHVQQDFGLTWGPKVVRVSYSLLVVGSTPATCNPTEGQSDACLHNLKPIIFPTTTLKMEALSHSEILSRYPTAKRCEKSRSIIESNCTFWSTQSTPATLKPASSKTATKRSKINDTKKKEGQVAEEKPLYKEDMDHHLWMLVSCSWKYSWETLPSLSLNTEKRKLEGIGKYCLILEKRSTESA